MRFLFFVLATKPNAPETYMTVLKMNFVLHIDFLNEKPLAFPPCKSCTCEKDFVNVPNKPKYLNCGT